MSWVSYVDEYGNESWSWEDQPGIDFDPEAGEVGPGNSGPLPGVDFDPEAGGYQVFKDNSDPNNPRNIVITPSGDYYLNGQKVWSPSGSGSNDWGSLVSKLGDWAKTPKGMATLAATAYSLGGGNKPTTGGWKGSIPKYEAIREQVQMPEYKPYSGQAVMGGKFFTDPQYVSKTDASGIAAAKEAALADAAKLKEKNPSAPAAAVGKTFAAPEKDMSGLRSIYLMPGMGLGDKPPVSAEPAKSPIVQASTNTNSGRTFGSLKELADASGVQPAEEVVTRNTLPTFGAALPPGYKYGPADEVVKDTSSIAFIEPWLQQPRVYAGSEDLPVNQPITAAQGGIMQAAKGRYLAGPTDGMADKIPSSIDGEQPAKLSHGEFVVPADVVSHLGNGNSDAGANELYKMMDRVRKARTGTTKQGKKIDPAKFTPGGIAGYASGGPVAFTTGGTTNTGLSNTVNSGGLGATQETNLAPWVGDYVGDMLGKAQALASGADKVYTGALSAGTSPLQKQAFTAASNINPQATFDTAAAQQYMNPFINVALQPQLEEMRRQADISRNQQAGRLARAGALGGGRQAIMESELLRNLGQQQALTTGKAYETAFDKAMGQYNTSRQQQLQDVNALAGLGAQERQIEQQGIDQLKAEFERQRQFPYEQLKFQQSMLTGLPIGSTTVTPNTSPISQLGLTTEQVGQLSKWLQDNVFKTTTG